MGTGGVTRTGCGYSSSLVVPGDPSPTWRRSASTRYRARGNFSRAGGSTFRIGVEDAYSIYLHEGELTFSNAEAVELAMDTAENLWGEVITDLDAARDYLGIEYTSPR